MKFNWGTGIVITIIAFISFIMYFVITMSTDKSYSHDLVTEKYYQQELDYQQEIDAYHKLNELEGKVEIDKIKEGLSIKFPEEFDKKKIKGKVFLYRPSNKQLDFEIPISVSDTYLLVPEKRLVDGRWNIKIQIKYEGTDYLYKNEFVY